jgi:hypothetical protein
MNSCQQQQRSWPNFIGAFKSSQKQIHMYFTAQSFTCHVDNKPILERLDIYHHGNAFRVGTQAAWLSSPSCCLL